MKRFLLHYLEMVAAMLAGMLVFGGALRGVLALAGVGYSMTTHPLLTIGEMGLTMALGMVIWMRIRRHAWPATLEMAAVMLVPALLLIPLVGVEMMSSGTAMVVEHSLMFPLMLVVMLRRRASGLATVAR